MRGAQDCLFPLAPSGAFEMRSARCRSGSRRTHGTDTRRHAPRAPLIVLSLLP
jgi:hypothetical protein